MTLKINPISFFIKKTKYLTKIDIVAIMLLFFYSLISYASIMNFPIVHSDEIWLNGIANEMFTQKSFAVTEPFFDLYPRTIHPFRWLYNGIIIFLRPLLGSSVQSIRTISLIFAILSLIFFYNILKTTLKHKALPLLCSIVLAVNIQFVYSSHQGRQEMMLVFLMLLGIYYLVSTEKKLRSLKLTFILIFAMGVHPNSFLLGVVFTMSLFMQGIWCPSSFFIRIKDIIQLAFYTGIGTIFYLLIGFSLNSNLVSQYLNYGTSLGIDQALTGRFEGFYWFFYKLYYQIGGTYDLFNIKLYLLILGLVLLFGLLINLVWFNYKIFSHKLSHFNPKIQTISSSTHYLLLITMFGAIVGLLLGILMIGRYNQTSIIFFFPILFLLIASVIDLISSKSTSKIINSMGFFLLFVLTILNGISLWNNLQSYNEQHFYTLSYNAMIETLKDTIPQDAVVLGNLNTLEAFDPHHFFDIRNLGFLETPIENYIKERKIDYIVLHEEMDYIWRNSPRWDFLYVNLNYYSELKDYLVKNATAIKTFENPLYAMRIARYSGTYPWTTTVYKLR